MGPSHQTFVSLKHFSAMMENILSGLLSNPGGLAEGLVERLLDTDSALKGQLKKV